MPCLLSFVLRLLLLATCATSTTTITYLYPNAGGLFTYIKGSIIAADASETTITGSCTPYEGYLCNQQRDYTVTAGPSTYAVQYLLHSDQLRVACDFSNGREAVCSQDGLFWSVPQADYITFTLTVTEGEAKLQPYATQTPTETPPTKTPTTTPGSTKKPTPSPTTKLPGSTTSEVPVTHTFSGESGFVTVTSLVPTTISPHSGTTTAATPGDASGLSGGAKAGIAVGVILAVLAVGGAVAAFLLYRRRKRNMESADVVPEMEGQQEWKPERAKFAYNELEAKHVSELSNGTAVNELAELHSPAVPQELPGSPVPGERRGSKTSES